MDAAETSFTQIQELDLAELAERPEWKTMLIDIVSQESLDPWDIDIAVLSTRFLDRMKKMKKLDLKISANVVLAASILLRYKSDSWSLNEEEEEQFFLIPDEIYAEPSFPNLRPVKRTTRRKVSLQELIAAVEDIMKMEKRRAERRIIPQIELPPALVAMMENSGETFEKRIDKVFAKIRGAIDKTGLALFSQLLDERDITDVVRTLMPLLHLANRGSVAIWQEKVFGEIFIQMPGYENGDGRGFNVNSVVEASPKPPRRKGVKNGKGTAEAAG